jgi:hypothetical protein
MLKVARQKGFHLRHLSHIGNKTWKKFYVDGFLSHLILNWLMLVRLFPIDDWTLLMGHGHNNWLTKWRSYMLMYVVHCVKSIVVYFLFHQWCMVYLLGEKEVWNDWNCSIYEVVIVVTRKFQFYDWIIKKNIWVTSLANI